MDILTNHIGYSAAGPKKAVIKCREEERAEAFSVLDLKGNKIYTGVPVLVGPVANWNTGIYYRADFPRLRWRGHTAYRWGSIIPRNLKSVNVWLQ